jgi:Outer membrane protein beta-barrel domain
MKKSLILVAVSLLLTMAAVAQDVPKFEVPIGFSFVNVHPDLSPITSFNIFGGGGGFVYNVTPWIGIKADFDGYTQGSGVKNALTNAGYVVGNVQGNVFTYMFGPQIKKHSGKFQPFGEALFGAAHSNAYANIYDSIHGITSGSSNNNAFAMEFGGGLDYALTPHFQIRPVEVDYLYTKFGINGTNYTGTQNNFKYFAGVNFTFGGK